MNNDNATNHRTLFGYYLPNELESQILEQLDLKTLVTSRMVNSQWQMAVDNLSYLWSGLTRRLGIADACESGRERCRAQKMLGDCWVTSSFCPVVKESETPESDLKLLYVRLNSTGKALMVTAIDPRSLTCQRWELQLMLPRSMTFSMVHGWRVNVRGASDWLTILTVRSSTEELFAPEEPHSRDHSGWIIDVGDGSYDSDDSDNESDDENDIDASDVAHDTIGVADNIDNIVNATKNADNAVEWTRANNTTFPGHIADQAFDDTDIQALGLLPYPLYAIVSLRRTPTNSVLPLALITMHINEVVRQIAVQPCKRNSCSEIQLLVLTEESLLLYSLAPSTESTEESTTPPPILSSPHASIVFQQTQTMLTDPQEELVSPYMSIGTTDSDLSSKNLCLYCVVCIQHFLHENCHYYSLNLVRIDCRQLQHLSSVRLPDKYSINSISEQTLLLVKRLVPDKHFRTFLKLVRYSVSAQNCLHLDYDPCEYHSPPWILFRNRTQHFALGQRFWYCIGGTERSLLTLVIYLIGCPAPLLRVNLCDLILQRYNPLDMDPCISYIASNWIDFGFEPDSPEQTPLLAMGWEDEVNLLIGWCCGPPKWPLSTRCQPAQISRNFQFDWPWLLYRRTAARQMASPSPSSGFD